MVIRTTGQDGNLVECSYKDLAVGDLLDVKINIDITVTRGADSVPRHVVHFSFDEIVLVTTIDGIKRVSLSSRSLWISSDENPRRDAMACRSSWTET